MKEISASLLSFYGKDCDMDKNIKLLNNSKVDFIHLDVMDGKFVDNKFLSKTELVKVIEKSVPKVYSEKQGHVAKRTFQAIRIEVNNELEPLYNCVINSAECLKENGRLCIITFHSLEDRAVKNAFADLVGKCTCPPDLPYCICGKKSLGKIITKKPILPSEEEMKNNPRSKSAKLRVFERI